MSASSQGLSRRGFLRAGVAALAGAAGCRSSTPARLDAALPDAAPPDAPPGHEEARLDRPGEQPDAAAMPTVFKGYRGLADLPYFALDAGGRLRCTVKDLPASIDFHTHLGLAYLAAPKLDLQASSAQVHYLFDCDGETPPCTIDLDRYANECATPAMLKEMDAELAASVLPGGSAAAKTHTIPNLLREMDEMGIEKAVVLPIAMNLPFNDDSTNQWLLAIQQAGAQARLIPFGSVHPRDGQAIEKLNGYAAAGIRGVKLHPPTQRFHADDDEAMAVYAECEKLKLPVMFHAGRAGIEPALVQPYAEMKHYVKAVADYPNVRFVFGHAGCRLDFDEALVLAKAYKNIWMDVNGQSLTHLRTLLAELAPERLVLGSDWPFYPQALSLAKVLMVTEGDQGLRKQLLQASAAQFLAG